MGTILCPIQGERLILCSADAGPNAQRNEAGQAGYFFQNAPWVGAVRNCAERLQCRFVILTTGHGLVESDTIITPYDLHIEQYPDEVCNRWQETIPLVLGNNRNCLILFYAGGCPREPYLNMFLPILRQLGISLLTFGQANMRDVDQIENCAGMLFEGTTLGEIAQILQQPNRLEFYFNI